MAAMKVLVFLPFAIVATSCIYPEPYPPSPHRPPYRPGGPVYPYARERESQQVPDSGTYDETGRYERIPGDNAPPPSRENSRPPAPRIDDDFEPGPSTPAPSQPKP